MGFVADNRYASLSWHAKLNAVSAQLKNEQLLHVSFAQQYTQHDARRRPSSQTVSENPSEKNVQ